MAGRLKLTEWDESVDQWIQRLALLAQHCPELMLTPIADDDRRSIAEQVCRAPFVAMRIQELYDVTQTPKIAMGRVPVVVHILTPGFKPVQVTQDLGGFWREHYPKLKSELQRRYPKHEWR